VNETKFQVVAILKILIRPPVSIFMFLMLYFMLDGLILLHQIIFIVKDVSRRRVKHLGQSLFKTVLLYCLIVHTALGEKAHSGMTGSWAVEKPSL